MIRLFLSDCIIKFFAKSFMKAMKKYLNSYIYQKFYLKFYSSIILFKMSAYDICQHVLNTAQHTQAELDKWRDFGRCVECDFHGRNLWLCLAKDCNRILCGDSQADHSTLHFMVWLYDNLDDMIAKKNLFFLQGNKSHCIHQNLSTLRLWCYLCDTEVFLYSQQTNATRSWQDDGDSSDAEEIFLKNQKPKGVHFLIKNFSKLTSSCDEFVSFIFFNFQGCKTSGTHATWMQLYRLCAILLLWVNIFYNVSSILPTTKRKSLA